MFSYVKSIQGERVESQTPRQPNQPKDDCPYCDTPVIKQID
jgi:hypothetical protein